MCSGNIPPMSFALNTAPPVRDVPIILRYVDNYGLYLSDFDDLSASFVPLDKVLRSA